MFRKLLRCASLLCFCLAGCTSTPQGASTTELKEQVYLANSEIFSVYSPSVDQHYRIQVRLPGTYQQNTQQSYPVIIKVDGQWDFLLAASAVNCVYFDGQMPEAIVIGIDWEQVSGDIHAIRSRDLLPAPVPNYPNSGHAERFTNALADEIMPEIDRRYRTDGRRVLLGGSWGGLYTTYALLQRPDAFFAAISIAGDYSIGPQVLQQLIDKHQQSGQLAHNRLYMGVGHWDPIAPGVSAIAQSIQRAQIPGFKLEFDQKRGFGHSGMNIPGYAAGYQFVFKRPALTLGKDQLKVLEGTYTSLDEGGRSIEIAVEGDVLTAKTGTGQSIPLTAQSPLSFYHPGNFYNVDFAGDVATVTTFFGRTEFHKIQ